MAISFHDGKSSLYIFGIKTYYSICISECSSYILFYTLSVVHSYNTKPFKITFAYLIALSQLIYNFLLMHIYSLCLPLVQKTRARARRIYLDIMTLMQFTNPPSSDIIVRAHPFCLLECCFFFRLTTITHTHSQELYSRITYSYIQFSMCISMPPIFFLYSFQRRHFQ